MGILFKKEKKEGEDKTDLLKELNDYYKESYYNSKQRRENWKKYYKYWTNQTISNLRAKWKSDIQLPFSNLITQIKIPVMTQNQPKANFVALNNTNDREITANILSKLVGNALWNKLKINKTIIDVITNSIIYDAGFWKIGWNADAEGGIGEVFVSAIEPFKIFPDPSASDIDNCRYIIHQEIYPISALKKKYPKFKDQITKDNKVSEVLFEDRKNYRGNEGTFAVDNNTNYLVEKASVKEFWLSPSVCDLKIMEVIERNEEIEEIPFIDEYGNQQIRQEKRMVEVKAPKYRYGRVITTINDKIIVDDKPNPYTHGKFPFVKQIITQVPNEFWGMGDIEQCIPLFDAVNHAYQQIDDLINQMCNLGWIVDDTINPESLKKFMRTLNSGVGQVKVVPIDKIKKEEPPTIPHYLFLRINDIVQKIEIMTGITDVLQGRGAAQHRTAKGLERIYEAATSRMGIAVRQMEYSLKEVAYLMASVCQQFYDTERTFSVVGTSNNIEEVIRINKNDIAGEFDVSIDSGASLPMDKKSRADLVFTLLGNHIFDMALSGDIKQKEIAKVVLDTVEFPGRETLLNVVSQVAPQNPMMPNPMMPNPMPQNPVVPSGNQLPPEAIELLNILKGENLPQ